MLLEAGHVVGPGAPQSVQFSLIGAVGVRQSPLGPVLGESGELLPAVQGVEGLLDCVLRLLGLHHLLHHTSYRLAVDVLAVLLVHPVQLLYPSRKVVEVAEQPLRRNGLLHRL